MAYITIAFTNRNDNYGGDLQSRINKFIDYYSHLVACDPDLFEFVICDWNPPEGRPLLSAAFDWSKLGHVIHVVVPPAVHRQLAGNSNSPMLDYFGRNVALRHGSAPFAMIINQDIFISRSLFDTLRRRQLDTDCFYRADRVDFDFAAIANEPAENIEEKALLAAFEIHRRHSADYDEISVPYTAATAGEVASGPEPGDTLNAVDNIIVCEAAEIKRHATTGAAMNTAAYEVMQRDDFYYGFYLHTNASGDFILASKDAFRRIHGLPERTDFYMHSDSYAVFQLFCAGYKLCIFRHPHKVFHADHDRSSRVGRHESMSYPEHEAVFSRMIRGDVPYTMNGANWGLVDFGLETNVSMETP